jgi:CheY-like chemotaxis protein
MTRPTTTPADGPDPPPPPESGRSPSECAASTPTGGTAAAITPKPPLAGSTILLAEDVYDHANLFSLCLTRAGAEAVCVPDGELALHHAIHGPPRTDPHDTDPPNDTDPTARLDLLILDLRLPAVSGFEAIRWIRERGIRTPALALTALATEDHRRDALAAGFDGFLTKPILCDDLVAACRRVIG